MFRFERKNQKLATRAVFARRVARSLGFGLVLIALSLALGMTGYMTLAHLSFVDAFLDASMILGGMGPLHPLETTGGKLFASFYALFSGLVFITTASVLIAPVLHRMLHWLHQGHKNNDQSTKP